MKSPQARSAFELAREHALGGARTPEGVVCVRRDKTDDLAADLRAIAKELGVTSGRCVMALSRSEAILKTIALPEGGLPEHELPAYVRLMLERQLPFPIERAGVDFVQAPHAPPALLAAAVRLPALDDATELATGAGFRGCDAVLVDEGLARLLAPVGERGDAVIGVFASGGVCEVVIARDGRLLLSRACELSDEDVDAIDTVVTESRRTLMSYRVRPDAVEVRTGALLCDEEMSIALTAELEPALGLGALERVETGADTGPASCARLAGVLALGDERIDFASPTTPPDRNAKVRQLAMLAVLLVIVVVGGMITFGLREKRALDAQLETLRAEVGDANRTALELIRTSGRLVHVRGWLDARADWSAHLDLLCARTPSNESMLFDRLSMGADSEIDYSGRGSRAYSDDRWTLQTGVAIGLTARASDTQTLRDFRAALIALDAYTVTPVGEDAGAGGGGRYPVVGGVTLRSNQASPSAPDLQAEAGDG